MKIYVLVGMIASGKSTYCTESAKEGQIIINDDAIVNLLHANQYNFYDVKLKVLYKSIENHIISTALALNLSVVVDRALNGSKKSRERWISLANSFDVQCEAIVFPKESFEIHAHRRFQSDARGHDLDYWLRVAKIHEEEYEMPSLTEGFTTIRHIPQR